MKKVHSLSGFPNIVGRHLPFCWMDLISICTLAIAVISSMQKEWYWDFLKPGKSFWIFGFYLLLASFRNWTWLKIGLTLRMNNKSISFKSMNLKIDFGCQRMLNWFLTFFCNIYVERNHKIILKRIIPSKMQILGIMTYLGIHFSIDFYFFVTLVS